MAARPRLHLSTARGWINDPHGVTWYEGRYHVFFQHVPDTPTWATHCHWGHMSGSDLVNWNDDTAIALKPDDGEAGCWSGTLVLDDDRPTILYTSVGSVDRNDSRIVMALGDNEMRNWEKLPTPVLEAPPGVTEFRDPSVHRDGAGWRMVVGCRYQGAATALMFRSLDLRQWSEPTILCQRKSDPADPLFTGDGWECVQFIEIDGVWVLIACAWTNKPDDRMVYAVGDFDGAVFEPRSWHRLDHGGTLYATTTFRDADGRWCALSWIRELEPPRSGRVRAGALSLPHRLSVVDDRLVIAPHPDVDRLLGPDLPLDEPLPPQFDLQLTLVAPVRIGCLELEHDGENILLAVGSAPVRRIPAPAGSVVRVVVDEDIAEVFAGGEVAVVRVPDQTDRIVGLGANMRLRTLDCRETTEVAEFGK
ncbi:glycoside hydrolase family 32 protein [Lentzea flaviverrucosa]|uniref:glycoside hydrolase family 32 protein n=1 Tax=Lentzea flaviverrucosa TaxID=200379 RepID=UPI001476DC22|nr:glycoside hydrolase family 32 protein [Lentzea flaviverrucosa]